LIGESYKDGTIRANISLGLHVAIVLKKDQKKGKLTTGVVQRILTNSRTQPHGIKVRLESGEIGRVKDILDQKVQIEFFKKLSFFIFLFPWRMTTIVQH
jgi:uncharacterized repeat protein (TIGR03833 family)